MYLSKRNIAGICRHTIIIWSSEMSNEVHEAHKKKLQISYTLIHTLWKVYYTRIKFVIVSLCD